MSLQKKLLLFLLFIFSTSLYSVSKINLSKKYLIHLNTLFQNRTIDFSGAVCSYQQRIKGNFNTHISFKSGKKINITYKANFFNQNIQMDNSFRVLYSDTRYFVDPNLAKEIYGYDRREVINITNFNQSILIYYFNGKIIKKNIIDFDENTIDEDALFVFLQSALMDGKKDFSANVLLASLSLKLPFNFKVVKTSKLASIDSDFNYPKAFLNAVGNQPEECYVYKITLEGIAGMLYRQKHYLAFEKAYPHYFIASWGGDPKNAEFIYRTKIK